MEPYEPEKVGARIAWGRSHSVYHYGNGEVIRFPKLEAWIWGSNLGRRFERDISLCKSYFGDYFLDTRIVENPTTNKIATIQPYIVGHYLSKADLELPETKRHFDVFMARHDELVSDGHAPIDLVGQGGVIRHRLSNLLVLSNGTLRLFDASTWDLSDLQRGALVAALLKKVVLRRQASTVRYLRS